MQHGLNTCKYWFKIMAATWDWEAGYTQISGDIYIMHLLGTATRVEAEMNLQCEKSRMVKQCEYIFMMVGKRKYVIILSKRTWTWIEICKNSADEAQILVHDVYDLYENICKYKGKNTD